MPSLPTPPILSPYLGPLRTYLSGDIEGAQQRVGLARLLVGQLRHRLALGGITSGRDAATFPDGAVIQAEVSGGLYQVQIHVPILDEEEGGTEFPYLSGLHEIARVYAADESSRAYAAQYFPSFSPNKNPRAWHTLNVEFADNQPWPLTPPLVVNGENPPGVAFAWRWIDRALPYLDFDFKELKGYPQWPTMYTGRMRMVAQKLLGRKLSNPFSTNCGIYVPTLSKPGVDQQRWIIQIDPLEGVFAWPVFFFDEIELLTTKQQQQVRAAGDTDRYDYGFSSAPTIPSDIDTDVFRVLSARGKTKLRLLSQADIAQVYEHNRIPMTPWYGNWAFSYDGHEAQIVLFEVKLIGNDPIYYSTRFKLSIATIGGHPSSASVAIVDEGYVALGEFDYQLWAPYQFPVQEDLHWKTNATPPAYDSPLYVFYDRNNTEVVLRQKCKPYGLDPDEITHIGFDCTSPVNCLPAGSFCPSDGLYVAAENCNVGEILEITNKASWTTCIYCERTFQPAYSSTYTIYEHTRWMGGVIGRTPWFVQCNLGGIDYVYAQGARIELFETETTVHTEITSYSNRVTLPIYEREGFYHYQKSDIEITLPYTHWENTSSSSSAAIYVDIQKHNDNTTTLSPPYTIGGAYDIKSPTSYDAGTIFSTPGYKFIGAIQSDDDVNDSAIIDLEIPETIGDDFSTNYPAIAAIEAFSGKCILMPEPKDSWRFNAEYPVHSSYRWGADQRPSNFCFIGDGVGDETWRDHYGTPDEFVEMSPAFPEKRSNPGSPIDNYAVAIPK